MTGEAIPADRAASATHGALLSIEGVSRRFGETRALDAVSIDVRRNEFFALLGPSGCGKTTLLRVLAGFEQPDSGSVVLGGNDLLALPPHRRPVNLMFQSYALFPHMSVEKNVAYGLERDRVARAEVRRRVGEVLETVGLSALSRRRPQQLSGGQRQRVALARAIVKRPEVLLLDEPLSALDRKVRAEMQLELKRLQHEVGTTFIVVTHDQEEAMSMADRIAVMHRGTVEQVDSPVELYQRPRSLFVADFIGRSNIFVGQAEALGLWTASGLLPGRAVHEPVSGRAHLVIRPEHVRLVGESEALLRGRVLESQFFGGESTVAVRVDGHDAPVLHSRPGPPTARRDDVVHLAWAAEDAVLLGA